MAQSTIGLLALAGTLLVHSPVSAQVEAIGFRLGLSRATQGGGFAELAENNDFDVSARMGVVAGAYVDYGLRGVHEHLSVQTGLNLAQKGMRIDRSSGENFRELDITYLEIPVLAKLAFAGEALRPYLLGGPVFAFKQGSSGTANGEAIDPDDELKGTDLGLALGLGVQRERFGVELRYVHGFPNITTSSSSNESAKNRQWALVATYEMPIVRR
jgi:hypothetical protein